MANRRASWVAVLVLVLCLPACALPNHSAHKLAELASRAGAGVDIQPLASPRDALARADLVVRGTLVDVKQGVTFATDNSELASRLSSDDSLFVVDVSEVIARDPAAVVDGKAYVNVLTGEVSAGSLARANPRAEVVAAAFELPAEPMPRVRYVRPGSRPANAPLIGAFLDGVWLQGEADASMYGLYFTREELPSAWASPTTLREYADRLRAAR